MSRASEYAKAAVQPKLKLACDKYEIALVGVDGRLILCFGGDVGQNSAQRVLSAGDALLLRDWLTETFGEGEKG